ncbi:MAG: hypothetical protein HKN73_17835 [Gemmatimonadetes bacterium]|nr:hypothetical protein [Gemmatimonadota bacterium]
MGRVRMGVQSVTCFLLVATVQAGCTGGGGGDGTNLTSALPTWQRIEATQPPPSWRVEEASPAFDAWEAEAIVLRIAALGDATVMGFEDLHGEALELRLPAIPTARFEPTLRVDDTVRVVLTRWEGFEGVAQGLAVFDRVGRLLFLYDDGGYGAAFHDAEARAGLSVERMSPTDRRGEGWATVDVAFRLAGESVLVAEGRYARLGQTDLIVGVEVSREWIGPPATDMDLNPLAYLAFRAR